MSSVAATPRAGDVGFRSLLQSLAANGRSDVVYTLINQDEKPGYGYQLKKGATSLTESWDASLGASHNHFMLGQVTEWLYQDLLGITADATAPGFKSMVIRPQPVPGLDWASASYQSIRGRVAVRWERKADRFTMAVTVPANTTATVHVPSRVGSAVTEGGAAADSRPGITFVRRDGDREVYRIDSGSYSFESRW